ncbi:MULTISPECIES: winged helix-turn-helix domain-containing protein [Mesorhizobium]|uniref:ATP-binding protein n=1 Tax=Mesorhizobium TaxID=68287 RepID=UPI0003CEE573|nr:MULTISPECIES: winged helix-turn-helix domain-containing protein [Mesorhizobium]ESY68924.1 transcriptional regulator [Mesorhizobium sp. LNHC232B00]WJI40609.1 helix-turn-helix transcriptional regulator [Mesorhizobium opportunistum]
MTDQAMARTDEVLLAPPHVEAGAQAPISFGSFRLDRAQRLLLRDGEPVRIGSRALDLLIVLVDHAGDVISKYELLKLVWRDTVVDEAGVRVHMAALRRTLGDDLDGARYIINIAGRGYSFVAPITREATSQPRPPPPPAVFHSARSRGRVPPPRSLIGREAVVDSLSELILARRFVSIVGSGGIGKTTVAVAIVQRLRTEFNEENIAFVDFGAVLEGGLVPGAVVSAVGCTIGGTDPALELLSFLADRRMLIVFDGCEHLVDPISVLAGQLFQLAPDVRLLVTSREALRIDGETVHPLSPLACPDEELPTALEALATPAVRLFMDRAAAGGFHEELSDIDAPLVSEICRRTDGIALAIELAASRAGKYGICGVADLLAGNMELGLTGRRNVAPRHQTLEAMLDWSFNLLADHERRVLARLSVFAGPFTLEGACSIAAEGEHDAWMVAVTMSSLVDKSLVWVHPAGDAALYRLPDTTRAYAFAKLTEIEETGPMAERHARYFVTRFKAAAIEHGAYADIAHHALHLGDVRKALEWSFSCEDRHAIGVELMAVAAPLFLGLWLFDECRNWSILALGVKKPRSNGPEQEVRLQEALALSSMYVQGPTQEVWDACARALSLSDAEGNAWRQLRLIAGMNIVLTRRGDFEGALDAARRFAAVAERGDSRHDHVLAEWMLGAGYHLAADQAAAAGHLERGFQLSAETEGLDVDHFGHNHRLRATLSLARVAWLTGAPQKGRKLAFEAMDEGARGRFPANYCVAVSYCVPILHWSGDFEASYEHIERALACAERYSLAYTGLILALKGDWLIMAGELSAGVDTLRHALKVLHLENHRIVTSSASRALANGLSLCGRHSEASTAIDGAISAALETNQKFWLPDLYRTQGEINLRGPSPGIDAAEVALRRSIEHAREQSATAWELKAAIPLAHLMMKRGRLANALTLVAPLYEAHSERSGSADLAEAQRIMASLK